MNPSERKLEAFKALGIDTDRFIRRKADNANALQAILQSAYDQLQQTGDPKIAQALSGIIKTLEDILGPRVASEIQLSTQRSKSMKFKQLGQPDIKVNVKQAVDEVKNALTELGNQDVNTFIDVVTQIGQIIRSALDGSSGDGGGMGGGMTMNAVKSKARRAPSFNGFDMSGIEDFLKDVV